VTVSPSLRQEVRKRANFACEFCGVTETDTGGELTVDHYQPKTKGGKDTLENLIYCCVRCNLHKANYWSEKPKAPHLWNPRQESFAQHFLELDDGKLSALTPTGIFTLAKLHLNRPPLAAYRLQKRRQTEETRRLHRYRDLAHLLGQLNEQVFELLEEQHQLLKEQQELLRLLLNLEE
jgi:hypothetical protein